MPESRAGARRGYSLNFIVEEKLKSMLNEVAKGGVTQASVLVGSAFQCSTGVTFPLPSSLQRSSRK